MANLKMVITPTVSVFPVKQQAPYNLIALAYYIETVFLSGIFKPS